MNKNEKSAGLQFIPNVKPYTTCFHPLDLKNTEINIANIVNLFFTTNFLRRNYAKKITHAIFFTARKREEGTLRPHDEA